MTLEELRPFIRHWCVVYLRGNTEAYCGTVLQAGDDGIIVNGDKREPASRALRYAPIARIERIEFLPDPEWLVEANRAAARLSAEGLLRSSER